MTTLEAILLIVVALLALLVFVAAGAFVGLVWYLRTRKAPATPDSEVIEWRGNALYHGEKVIGTCTPFTSPTGQPVYRIRLNGRDLAPDGFHDEDLAKACLYDQATAGVLDIETEGDSPTAIEHQPVSVTYWWDNENKYYDNAGTKVGQVQTRTTGTIGHPIELFDAYVADVDGCVITKIMENQASLQSAKLAVEYHFEEVTR